MPPEGRGDELEEGEDAVGAGGEGLGARWGGAVEEEGEEAQAEGVALFVEAVAEISRCCSKWELETSKVDG